MTGRIPVKKMQYVHRLARVIDVPVKTASVDKERRVSVSNIASSYHIHTHAIIQLVLYTFFATLLYTTFHKVLP